MNEGKIKRVNKQPTNADLKKAYEKHAEDDRVFQTMQLEVNEDAKKSRDAIHKRLKDIPSKEETASIVEEVITKLLFKKGKLTISIVIGVGAVVAAIVSILGGFKALLALFFIQK